MRIKFILKDMTIALENNLLIMTFSAVFSFIILFYMADLGQFKNNLDDLNDVKNAYFLQVANNNLEKKDIQEIEKKNKLHYVKADYYTINEKVGNIFTYDEYMLNNINYLLEEGRLPNKKNEVLLTSSYGNKYNIGEDIEISVTKRDGSINTEKYIVVGILKDDIVFYPIGTGAPRYDLFYVECDDNIYFKDSVISINQDLYDDEDDAICYNVEILNGESFEDNRIKYENVGDLYSNKEIIDYETNKYETERSKDRILLVAGLAISLSSYLASIYIAYVKRRKEYGIMLLNGGSESSVAFLLKADGLIAAFIGAIAGSGVIKYLTNKKAIAGVLAIGQIILVIALVLIIYLMCLYLIRICHKRETVIELIKNNI